MLVRMLRAPIPIQAVLLDIDDTLVDTMGAFRHALIAVARIHLPGEVDPDDIVRFWRADRNDHYGAYTRGEMDYRSQRMLRANDLHAQWDAPTMDDDAYDEWDATFEQSFRDNWVAYEDAHLFLDSLDVAGIPYGALSNASVEYQTIKLERAGLSRVPMLVGVDSLGYGKPDPRVFLEGATRLGVPPAQVAYIGDDYAVDALASRDAGLVAVWLDRPGARRVEVPDDASSTPGVIHAESLEQLAFTRASDG